MKVAHFGNFAPHRAGIHTMVRDLVLAERSVGIESNFIDYGSEPNCTFSRVWLTDGVITTVSPDWAITDADIIVHHSAIPKQVVKTGKPIVFYMHGRPEYNFMLDWKKGVKHLSAHFDKVNDPQYKKFITFWKSHQTQWKYILNKDDVEFVNPPVDLSNYPMDGKTYSFVEADCGSPNILICDMWREDITPLNTILAALLFAEKYCPTAKIHIIAVPFPKQDNSMDALFYNFKKSGYVGKVATVVQNVDEIMRAADILVSPLGIETRTILEASALGLPIVAGNGCKLAHTVSDPRDIEATAAAINKCWNEVKSVKDIKNVIRNKTESQFNLLKTGIQVKQIYEGIL